MSRRAKVKPHGKCSRCGVELIGFSNAVCIACAAETINDCPGCYRLLKARRRMAKLGMDASGLPLFCSAHSRRSFASGSDSR